MDEAAEGRQRRLRDVEDEIERLRRSIGTLKGQLGDGDGAAEEPAEAATDLTMVQEQEAVLAELERRRDELRGDT